MADPRMAYPCSQHILLLIITAASVTRRVESFDNAPKTMNNIDYAGRGYDMVLANPRCTPANCGTGGFDPGFSHTSGVIEISYAGRQLSGDQRFLEPDGFDVTREVACGLASSTSSTHSAYDYQSSLSVDANAQGTVNAKLVKVGFSASVDYQHTKNSVGSHGSTHYSVMAVCSIYRAKTKPYTTLNLTSQFKNGVASLTADYDYATYATFVKAFGTHYTSNVMMGAKYTHILSCSNSDSNNLTATGVNVQAAVQVDALIAHVGGSTNVTWHKSDHDELVKKDCTASQSIIGTAPPGGLACTAPCRPSDVDIMPWQTGLLNNSESELMPVQYDITGIDTLLTKAYFPSDPDIAKKQENLFTYLSAYCNPPGAPPGPPTCAPPNPMGTWMPEPMAPQPRLAAAALSTKTDLYVLGGVARELDKPSSSVAVFTSSDRGISWDSGAVPPMPTARSNLTAEVQNDFVFAIGGEDAHGTPLGIVEVLSLTGNTWSGGKKPMLTPRTALASVATDDGKIVTFGGRSVDGASAAVEMYDPDLDSWSTLPTMTTPREAPCAGILRGVTYIAGGWNGTHHVNSVETFTPGSSSWTQLPAAMTHARSGAACAVVEDALVVFGGRSEAGVTNAVEAFDPGQNSSDARWIGRTAAPTPLWLAAGGAVLDASEQRTKMFVAGGARSAATPWVGGTQKWSCKTGAELLSSPVLSPDSSTVFVGSNASSLYAVDASSGKQKWSFKSGAGVSLVALSPVVSPDGSIVFVGGNNFNTSRYSLYAVDVSSRKQKWLFAKNDLATSPAVSADGSTVFVGSEDNNLYAVDASSGKQKWPFQTDGPVRSPPVLSPDGSTVFVASWDYNLYAVDASSGTQKWLFQTRDIVGQPAVSADGSTVFVTSGNWNYAVDASSGKQKWQFGGGGTSLPVLSPDGNTVFFASDEEEEYNLYAVDASSGKQKWQFETLASPSSPAVSADGSTVFVGSEDNKLYAVDASNGKQKWLFKTSDGVSSPVLSLDGSTVFVSAAYNLYAVALASGQTAEAPFWSLAPEIPRD